MALLSCPFTRSANARASLKGNDMAQKPVHINLNEAEKYAPELRKFFKPHLLNNISAMISSLENSVSLSEPMPQWHSDLFNQTRASIHNRLHDELAHFMDDFTILKAADMEFLTPIEFYSVSEWLSSALEKKGEIITRAFDFPIWGRQEPYNIESDRTLFEIYLENKPLENNINYREVGCVYHSLLTANIEMAVKILIKMQSLNKEGIKSLHILLLSNKNADTRYQILSQLVNLALRDDHVLLTNFPTL